jgi:AAHS family 4-hydroxybenzoate transporter-like MFS transporter
MGDRVIDIETLVDNQPLRAFHIRLAILVFVIMLTDGYDQMSVGFAAPGFVRDLHLDRAMLGPIFGASLLGMLIGSPIFGWLGDRYGRRLAIISGIVIYSITSLLSAGVTSQTELLLLRLVAGLGLGGVPVNSIALMAEYMPKHVRARLIVLAQLGLTFGAMAPAAISAFLEAHYDWKMFFYIGGIVPLAMAILLFFTLPESMKFMALFSKNDSELRKIAQNIDPRLQLSHVSSFSSGLTGKVTAQNIRQLFSGDLVIITPILWILYNTFLSANYFLHGWIPILFRDHGLSVGQIATVMTLFDFGGVLGALMVSRWVDKHGLTPIVALYVVSFPALAAIGFLGNLVHLLYLVIFIAGFSLVGITLGMHAVVSGIYPTEARAKGLGWAYGLGRIGSIAGPWIGGAVVGMAMPISAVFLVPAIPMGVGAVLSFALMRLCALRSIKVLHDDPSEAPRKLQIQQ